ncbi:MAG: PAS domain S-box protein [Acidobacteria bacterium]|nr:PAS domain S-box protein [Acidobacteriota bacterium]
MIIFPAGMMLTRKIGALLLLLTLGSLAGTATFAIFFARTAEDGLFLVGAQIQLTTIQELHILTLQIRDGQPVHDQFLDTVRFLDGLLGSLENGGKNPSAGAVTTLERISNARSGDTEQDVEDIVEALQEGLPQPGEELRKTFAAVRKIWTEMSPAIYTVGNKNSARSESSAAYELLNRKFPELKETARFSLTVVGDQVGSKRTQMLATLASIAAVSIALFGIGLWVTKRHVTIPLALIEKTSRRIREGDFSQRIPIVSDDEIASLARTVNEMCAEIERSVERYRELFENANDIVYTVGLDGNFTAVNRAAERVCGYTHDELLRMKIDQLVAPGQMELTLQMRDRKVSGEKQMTVYPIQIVTKDGRNVCIEISTRLVYENGVPVAVQGIGRDITERQRLEQQLWLSQKMEAVGRLAGGIAHEFGNVLTIITGYCTLLLSSLKKDDPSRSEVEGIQKAAQRAGSLIRHLLGFSKGQVFRPRVLDIENTLRDMTDMLHRLVGEDIELTCSCDPQLGRVRFDPAQLEQVMVNLALNARDAMPGGGRLTIRVQNFELTGDAEQGDERIVPGPYVRITVADTGCGIKPEVFSQIFEPFFTTKDRGTGLGLSTVYGIVRQYNGKISVESYVNHGTTFTILLPRLDEPAEVIGTEPAAITAGRGTETILLVEDNEDVRWLVSQMLQASGYQVLEARDQDEAIELCVKLPAKIDLMLTDVVMPHMSGPELATKVRPFRPDMKVLYMSGHTQDKFARHVVDSDVNFIQKPLTPEVLATKVREVLDLK